MGKKKKNNWSRDFYSIPDHTETPKTIYTYNLGDIVKITVETPSGCNDTHVKGCVGAVTEVGEDDGKTDYQVTCGDHSYWYTAEELEPATNKETEAKLYQLLSNMAK